MASANWGVGRQLPDAAALMHAAGRLPDVRESAMSGGKHVARRSVDPRVICIVAVLLSAATHSATPQIASVRFPGLLESYFTNAVKLSTVERQRLIKGEPLTKMLEADETKEVAVFGAVWISAPIRRYVEAVKDIETFERGGGFRVTKRISAQPRLEDFSELRLPQEDLDDLPSCRVGDCDVKLGEQAIKRFRSEINWKAPDARAAANRLMQQLAFEYVTRYLEEATTSSRSIGTIRVRHSSPRNSGRWSTRCRS